MSLEQDHVQIKRALDKNSELVEENNKILHKIYRNAVWGFWLRVIWYLILIGLPFAFYFYVFEPYFAFFGADYNTFRAGISEIPGLKGFDQFFSNGEGGS